MAVALRLRGIEKSYGGTRVLHPLDLEVEEGEFFVLLGPSGCGKTTLLRLIAGLLESSGGEIYLGDQPVTALPPERRDIAMVFQDYALYPHLTAYRNWEFGLKRHGVPADEIRRRIARTAGLLGLDRLLQRKPAELSGGQQQRVALGRAIVREPRLFLMDEPLSNLDAQIRATTRAELKQLQRRVGIATVYVTHDQVEAMTLADRMAVLSEGRVQQVGPPLEVYARPANVFVGRFLSNPRYNLLAAQLHDEGARHLRTAVGAFPVPAGALREAPPELLVGMRPEQVAVSATPGPGQALEVVLVEPLGAELLLHLQGGEEQLVARLPAALVRPDVRKVWLNPSVCAVQVFDARSQALLDAFEPAEHRV